MNCLLSNTSDGDAIDCCATFLSKRVDVVDGSRTGALRLDLESGERCRLLLGPATIQSAYGIRTGSELEVRFALVCETSEPRLLDEPCPACGGLIRQRRSLNLDIVSDAVRSTARILDDTRVLVAIPGTSLHPGCTSDVPWRTLQPIFQRVDQHEALCINCGRSVDSTEFETDQRAE
jgi:hypothetical protein